MSAFCGAALLAVFAAIERSVAGPLFQLRLLRIRAFTFGCLTGFTAWLAQGGLQFVGAVGFARTATDQRRRRVPACRAPPSRACIPVCPPGGPGVFPERGRPEGGALMTPAMYLPRTWRVPRRHESTDACPAAAQVVRLAAGLGT